MVSFRRKNKDERTNSIFQKNEKTIVFKRKRYKNERFEIVRIRT